MSLMGRIERGELPKAKIPLPEIDLDADLNGAPINADALIARAQAELLAKLDPAVRENPPPYEHSAIAEMLDSLLDSIFAEENRSLSQPQREKLGAAILAEITGWGPLDALWSDPAVTEIMVVNPKTIYMVHTSRIQPTGVSFHDEAHTLKTLNRMLGPIGQRIDAANPIVRAKFPDGTRLHAVAYPIASNGTTIVMQKFLNRLYPLKDLMRFGTLTGEVAAFLRACVIARLNIIVSGQGLGSGITTLLNALADFVPRDERIITIETRREVVLRQAQVISLIPRKEDEHGRGQVTMRDLVQNAGYMVPGHIVVDMLVGGEALDLLHLMVSHSYGVLAALHAHDPHDALKGIEAMCGVAEPDLPAETVRRLITSAVDLVVQIERMRDGSRKVVSISEVQGTDGHTITLSDIFQFKEQAGEGHSADGFLVPTGVHPRAIRKIGEWGIKISPWIFDPRVKDTL